MTTNITQEHRDFFDALTSGAYSNFALVHTTFDGEPTATIATVANEGDSFIVTPIVVFITESMMDRMTDPREGLDEEKKNVEPRVDLTGRVVGSDG